MRAVVGGCTAPPHSVAGTSETLSAALRPKPINGPAPP